MRICRNSSKLKKVERREYNKKIKRGWTRAQVERVNEYVMVYEAGEEGGCELVMCEVMIVSDRLSRVTKVIAVASGLYHSTRLASGRSASAAHTFLSYPFDSINYPRLNCLFGASSKYFNIPEL